MALLRASLGNAVAGVKNVVESSALEAKVLNQPESVSFQYLTLATKLPRVTYPVRYESGVVEKPNVSPSPVAPRLDTYRDPYSWTPARKVFVTWLSCVSTVVTTYTPGAYTAGLPQYRTEWGVSTTAVYGGITTFTLCFAMAPMVLAPFSEIQGRRPVFLLAGVAYVVSQLGSAVTASFAGLLVTRALAGVSCSVFSTMVGGVVSDIYVAKERNTAMAIFTGAALFGCGMGPMVSAAIAEHISWRWIYYVQTITCGLVVTALFLFFPETRGTVLLSKKAKALNAWYDKLEDAGYRGALVDQEGRPVSPASNPNSDASSAQRLRWKVKADEERATLGVMIKISLSRPFHLLFTESVVFWFSLWMAFAWTILYLTFELLPLMFEQVYGFSTQASGFVFSAVSVASVIGVVAAIWQDRVVSRPRAFLSGLHIQGQPEARLLFACGQSLLLPIGLFWLGATARASIPWAVPVVSVGFITLGIFSVYLAVFNYLADTYNAYASSAIAAQSFTRNVFAACLPLATEAMFTRLESVGVGCLLGGVGLLLSVVPWVLVVWGPRIRARSKLATKLST